ncbi:MAG: hypothetical protein RBT47_03250 [Anaerolineae bacterium]|jgi:hypothetical protein|nr:hypothetical protein [Anaerolineae bacterium]
MVSQILLYVGSFFLFVWGVAHLFPTRSVVAGFGDISIDNKRIITMEWIIEGLSLIFIAAVVALATTMDATAAILKGLYWLSVVMLAVLVAVSLFTGAKINFLPFKLCPVIFTTAAVLIALGSSV